MRGPWLWRRASVLLGFVFVAALCVTAGVALAGRTERPASEVTEYSADLRNAAKLAEQAASSTGRLASNNARGCRQVEPAAAKLAAAADAAKAVFERYRKAKSRYGTQEEIQLITAVVLNLREGQAALAKVAGEASAPSAAEQQAAEREVGLFQTIIARKVEDRLEIEGLADVLASTSFREMKDKVVSELHTRLRTRAEAELRRLTGLRIKLNVPLKQQIRDFIESELSRHLTKLVIAAGPAGILISIVGGRLFNPGRLVELIGAKLRAALRQKGNLDGRTKTSLAGLEQLRRSLNAFAPDAPIDKVRKTVRDAQRELGRTKFLEGDLAKAGKNDLLQELTAAKRNLERTISLSKRRFLLDSDLVGEDFRLGVTYATKLRAETERLARKLGCEPPPAGGGGGTAPGKGGPPTAATCPAPFTMEVLRSLPPNDKVGEFQLTAATVVKTYPPDPYHYKCIYLHAQDRGEAFVIFFDLVPPGLPGRLVSGDCARRSSNPLLSEKRYLSVSGGERRAFTRAAGGNEKILLQALKLAESQGVGQACLPP